MKGSQHELVVESLANSGDGVGRIDNKVVFIPFSCPGDRVLVKITEDKKTFSKAQIVKILEPSAQRRDASCPHFGRCGGCDWQHIQYETQLAWKKKNLLDALHRIGGIESDSLVEDVQPSPNELGYRNRIQLHMDKNGPHYFAKNSRQPVYIDTCPLAENKINLFLQENKKSLVKRGPKIEIAKMPGGDTQVFSVNEKGQSSLGFRQINDVQNNFIKTQVSLFLSEQEVNGVLDLYCGKGNWTLRLAEDHPQVKFVGVDNNPVNIDSALSHKGPNSEFVLADATHWMKENSQTFDLIILDPPRAGSSKEILDSVQVSWLVYVSCHPATMARDLKTLLNRGFQIERIKPVDMFPQTAHLECLTILRGATPPKTANC